MRLWQYSPRRFVVRLGRMLVRWRFVLLIACACVAIWPLHYVYYHTAIPVYLLDWLSLRPFFLPDIRCQQCNNFTFSHIIANEEVCASEVKNKATDKDANDDVFLLILVAAYHANVDARRVIRQTWGGVRSYHNRRIVTLFVFGTHNDANFNMQLHIEQRQHGDIIQADYHDSYQSLTNKTIMALQWVQRYCPKARFILKTDEDSFNVPQRYVDFLINMHPDDRFVGGYCFTVKPDRRQSSKYFIRYDVYPDSFYPTYCAGPGYIISRAAVTDLERTAHDVNFLPMEDVFVTGFCRETAGIPYRKIPGMVMGSDDMTKCGLATYVKNAHNINPDQCERFWNRVIVSETDPECEWRHARLGFALVVFALIWLKVLSKLRANKSHQSTR